MCNRILSVLLAAALILAAFSACGRVPGEAPSGGTVTVTDRMGRTVQVPEDPQSICAICPYAGMLVVMFGYGDRITSTCNNLARSNLLTEICPEISSAAVVKNSGDLNAEEILARNTDLIIVNDGSYVNEDQRAKLDTLGIPYIVTGFQTIEEQFEVTRLIGKALGAEKEAESYIEYFRSVMDDVSSKTAGAKPVRLYHSVNEAVRTDQRGDYCSQWIALTGAENVSAGDPEAIQVNGEKSYTTLEQIYIWNPGLIICNEAMVDEYILSDPKWAEIEAVKSKKVYQIPIGITRMGHPTSLETPLAILWLAQLLHPELFDFDFSAKLREFYDEFFDFTLSDEWIDAMLEGNEMRTPKTNGGE